MHEGQTLSWTLAVFCQEGGTIIVPTTQSRRQRLQPAMLAQLETGELGLESSRRQAALPPGVTDGGRNPQWASAEIPRGEGGGESPPSTPPRPVSRRGKSKESEKGNKIFVQTFTLGPTATASRHTNLNAFSVPFNIFNYTNKTESLERINRQADQQSK